MNFIFNIKSFSIGFDVNNYYNTKLLDMFNWIFKRGSKALLQIVTNA